VFACVVLPVLFWTGATDPELAVSGSGSFLPINTILLNVIPPPSERRGRRYPALVLRTLHSFHTINSHTTSRVPLKFGVSKADGGAGKTWQVCCVTSLRQQVVNRIFEVTLPFSSVADTDTPRGGKFHW